MLCCWQVFAPLAATIFALAPGAAAFASPAPRSLLVFRGNLALTDEVYAYVVDVPANSKATQALAEEVEERISRFLHRCGYDLATVSATVKDAQVVVDIDEGRVDRIVFLGESAVGTLFFRLQTLLPFNIFDRPLLQRQLAQLKEQFNLRSVRWQIVAVGKKEDPLPIEVLQNLRDEALRRLREDDLAVRPTGFELRISVEHHHRGGFSPVLGIGANGIEVGAVYQRPDLLFRDDSVELETRVGGNSRQRIDTGQRELFLSHLSEAVRWFSPRLFRNDRLRFFIEGGADLISRQRLDIDLNSFRFLTLDGSLNLNASLGRNVSFSLGAGYERRWLFDVEPATAATPLLPQVAETPLVQTRLFGTASLHALLPPEELRYDRKHRADLLFTIYGLPSVPILAPNQPRLQARIDAQYQRVRYFGYHELWLQARSFLLFGDVPFPDDHQVSDVTRGTFGNIFVRKVGGPRVEFRFSLLRDVLQFGIYDDAALYGALDRSNNETLHLANTVGFAVHALLVDSFQLDIYLGTGITSQRGNMNTGLSLSLVQAY
jgi:hypothetical protein